MYVFEGTSTDYYVPFECSVRGACSANNLQPSIKRISKGRKLTHSNVGYLEEVFLSCFYQPFGASWNARAREGVLQLNFKVSKPMCFKIAFFIFIMSDLHGHSLLISWLVAKPCFSCYLRCLKEDETAEALKNLLHFNKIVPHENCSQ